MRDIQHYFVMILATYSCIPEGSGGFADAGAGKEDFGEEIQLSALAKEFCCAHLFADVDAQSGPSAEI